MARLQEHLHRNYPPLTLSYSQVLDLSKNCLSGTETLQLLYAMSSLRVLYLQDNPITQVRDLITYFCLQIKAFQTLMQSRIMACLAFVC